jgi:hypothetical protein
LKKKNKKTRIDLPGRSHLLAIAWSFVLAFFTAMATSRAEPIRILVTAASTRGLSSDRPLVHAREDASGVRDVFTSLGGVSPTRVIQLPEATREGFFAVLEAARGLAAGHDPKELTLFVYFSGHGDRATVHIGGDRVPLSEISRGLAAIPAGLRVVIVDACRTEPLRAKGNMQSEPGFAISLSSDAATTGTAWLYAAADGQGALESDEIGGAIFTHFWLAGLRGAGDVNGDGRVTLEESFHYAYGETLLRSTRSGGVLQRPEAKLDLAQESPVVLTELGSPRARLVLPRGGDALYLVYGVRSRSVIAEVYGAPERQVQLALSSGRYIVQRHLGARGGAAEIALDERTERVLQDSDFRAFPDEALALKGSLVLHPWRVVVTNAAFAGSGITDEMTLKVGWLDPSGTWEMSAGPVLGLQRVDNAYNDVSERLVGGEVSLDRHVPLSPRLVLRVGLDGRGEWIWQRVTRADASHLAGAGLTLTRHYAGAAWAGGAHLGLRLSLTDRWFADAAVSGRALGAKTDMGVEGRLLGGAQLGVGIAW